MNKQGRRQKAEGDFFSRSSRCAHLSFPLPPSSFRLGTTLIELLITITIIAILSATFLGVSNVAMESAREARTKTTIGKINGLLMEKWNSYATRRVDVHPTILNQINGDPALSHRVRGLMRADARLLATRELMKLEMPDRWSDILLQAVPDGVVSTMGGNDPLILAVRPGLSTSYLRKFFQSANVQDDGVTLRRNQGAECLYLIIMLATADGEARTLFSPQDIGDTDGDGAPEFLDGWGRPIRYIRWPAGFAVAGQSVLMLADADADHDSFDQFRRDQPQPAATQIPINLYPSRVQLLMSAMRNRNNLATPVSAFRLLPLVYSSGADGDSDLVTFANAVISDPYLDYSQSDPVTQTQQPSLGGLAVSDNDGDNWLDNIHNHLQDNK